MRDKSELTVDINSGQQAEAIVNHPLFIAAIKTLREVTIDTFESLGFEDVNQMRECNIRLGLIEELEQNLVTIIQNGETAFNTLEEIQTYQQELDNER